MSRINRERLQCMALPAEIMRKQKDINSAITKGARGENNDDNNRLISGIIHARNEIEMSAQ